MNQLLQPILLKLDRAENQALVFCKLVSDWCSKNPVKTQCLLREKRLGFKIVIDEFDEPAPLENFGFHFGEFIHNLRSLLDNLVFALASIETVTPRKPDSLFFPIVKDQNNFFNNKRIIKCLKQLPSEVAELITKIQPFQRNDPNVQGKPEQDPLVLLQWFNNNDKHRVPVITLVAPKEIAPTFAVEFYSDQDADLNVPPDITIWADQYKPGTVILEQRTNCPIKSVAGRLECKVVLSIKTINELNPVDKVVVYLLNYVKLVVNEFIRFF